MRNKWGGEIGGLYLTEYKVSMKLLRAESKLSCLYGRQTRSWTFRRREWKMALLPRPTFTLSNKAREKQLLGAQQELSPKPGCLTEQPLHSFLPHSHSSHVSALWQRDSPELEQQCEIPVPAAGQGSGARTRQAAFTLGRSPPSHARLYSQPGCWRTEGPNGTLGKVESPAHSGRALI